LNKVADVTAFPVQSGCPQTPTNTRRLIDFLSRAGQSRIGFAHLSCVHRIRYPERMRATRRHRLTADDDDEGTNEDAVTMTRVTSACAAAIALSAFALTPLAQTVYPTGTTIYDPAKSWNGFTVLSPLAT